MKKLKERHQFLEDKVAELEEHIATHERELAHFKSVDETLRVNGIVESSKRELQSVMTEWEQIGSQIEALA